MRGVDQSAPTADKTESRGLVVFSEAGAARKVTVYANQERAPIGTAHLDSVLALGVRPQNRSGDVAP